MKKRFFANKKAQGDIESYFIIIKIILAMIAIFAMSAYVYSVATDTFFYKFYLSRDIAFMINTIYSAPGNVYQIYERKGLENFEIDFQEHKVKIREEDMKKKGLSFDYYFARNLNYQFKREEIKNDNKIVFQKTPAKVEIDKEITKQLKALKCPEINTIDQNWKQKFFLIDAGHGDNTGFSNENIKEDIIAGSMGLFLHNKLENKDATRNNLEGGIDEQSRKSIDEIKKLTEQSDVIISIHIGNSPSNNNVKAYFSSIGNEELINKRKKLGCLIINELFSDEDLNNIFTGGNVISVNPKYVEKDYEIMLDNNKISIVLEIGNIQSEEIKKLSDMEIIAKIPGRIYNGVRKNYEGD